MDQTHSDWLLLHLVTVLFAWTTFNLSFCPPCLVDIPNRGYNSLQKVRSIRVSTGTWVWHLNHACRWDTCLMQLAMPHMWSWEWRQHNQRRLCKLRGPIANTQALSDSRLPATTCDAGSPTRDPGHSTLLSAEMQYPNRSFQKQIANWGIHACWAWEHLVPISDALTFSWLRTCCHVLEKMTNHGVYLRISLRPLFHKNRLDWPDQLCLAKFKPMTDVIALKKIPADCSLKNWRLTKPPTVNLHDT